MPSGFWRSPTTASSTCAGRAAPWLSRMMANRVPSVGRIALTPMLNERGKLIGDFTLCRRRRGSFLSGRHLRGRNLLHALVRAARAASRRDGAAVRDGIRRTVACRAALARAAAEPGARRSVDGGFSVHVVPAHGGRHGAGLCRARVLHRRSRVRDLGDHRLSARAVRAADAGRPRATGSSCSAGARSMPCASRRASAPGRGSFGRSTVRSKPVSAASSTSKKGEFIGRAAAAAEKETGRRAASDASRWRRPMPTRSAMSRSGTTASRSAGSPRVPTGIASASRSRSATCPRRWRQADEGFEIEIIGERRAALRLQGARLRSDGLLDARLKLRAPSARAIHRGEVNAGHPIARRATPDSPSSPKVCRRMLISIRADTSASCSASGTATGSMSAARASSRRSALSRLSSSAIRKSCWCATTTGRLQGFHNTCRHRGAELCRESPGSLRTGAIVCPYHAWVYNLQGELLRTSSKAHPRRFRSSPTIRSTSVRVLEWSGFMFVSLARQSAAVRAACSICP